ncbi:MAG: hypothetical protein HC902_12035 [Calothrix sp. SM1_5_4]|nr:hypothetical protein [Calothrix sp. SM1_5_4]
MRNRFDPGRLREEAKALLRREWERRIETRLASVRDPSELLKLLQSEA